MRIPSIPGAPRLPLARIHARRRFCASSTSSINATCKAGCVAQRLPSIPPLGFVIECESLTAPPCPSLFGPSPPYRRGYYGLC